MEEDSLFDIALLDELGDKKSVLIVLSFFLDNSPKDIKELETMLDEKDLSAVYNKAHKLKGSLAMLKAQKLVALLEQLETVAGIEKNMETAHSLTLQVIELYQLLIVQLAKEVANIQSEIG